MFAAECYEHALDIKDVPVARNRLGEGLEAADKAIRLAPNSNEAHVIRAAILGALGRVQESLTALDEAGRLGASDMEIFHVRAVVRMDGDPAEALADCERVLAINPGHWAARMNRCLLKLSIGDWRGWTDHEWRLKERGHPHHSFMKRAPQWQDEPLAGRRLLVYSEQEDGETFQFVRYLRLIENGGAQITLTVHRAAICRLLAENFPGIDVIAVGPLPAFDFHASLMSLPAILALESVPATVPYLMADEERVAKWRQRLGTEGFRVGIAWQWQGSPEYGCDQYRSIPLAAFAPLAAVPGVRLISVQARTGLAQLDALPPGMAVERLGEEIENNPDFRDMAAVLASLDLIIMLDTFSTHLAGALGRPVWLATPRNPDWRWMRDREDSPWYPTLRLFRQETAGDWSGVFARMARELAEVVAARTRILF